MAEHGLSSVRKCIVLGGPKLRKGNEENCDNSPQSMFQKLSALHVMRPPIIIRYIDPALLPLLGQLNLLVKKCGLLLQEAKEAKDQAKVGSFMELLTSAKQISNQLEQYEVPNAPLKETSFINSLEGSQLETVMEVENSQRLNQTIQTNCKDRQGTEEECLEMIGVIEKASTKIEELERDCELAINELGLANQQIAQLQAENKALGERHDGSLQEKDRLISQLQAELAQLKPAQ